MSLNANLVPPPLSPQQQNTDLPAALLQAPPDVANPSEPSGLSDDHIAPLLEALKSNTHLTRLVIFGDKHSKTVKNQMEILLTQNKDIAELRQYVLDHPLISTVDIPTDVIKILEQQIIVSYLKSGQTKEATKKAIDEFLVIASTTALAKDSKTN